METLDVKSTMSKMKSSLTDLTANWKLQEEKMSKPEDR